MAVSNTAILSGASLLIDSDATSTAVAVKASSGVLYEIQVDNSANAAASYLKLYNTASPTVGTTAPDMIILAPASARITLALPSGVTFGTATSYACVTTGGTAGTTNPTSDVTVRIVYV